MFPRFRLRRRGKGSLWVPLAAGTAPTLSMGTRLTGLRFWFRLLTDRYFFRFRLPPFLSGTLFLPERWGRSRRFLDSSAAVGAVRLRNIAVIHPFTSRSAGKGRPDLEMWMPAWPFLPPAWPAPVWRSGHDADKGTMLLTVPAAPGQSHSGWQGRIASVSWPDPSAALTVRVPAAAAVCWARCYS